MTVLAASQQHALWGVALGLGFVIIAVVIVLMMLLLSFLKDIEASAGVLLQVGGQVAANTAHIPQLAATGPVLEQIKEEALIHDGYLASLL
jgi:protein-S-isoprenylcysteine O-methyltransferase Ste14